LVKFFSYLFSGIVTKATLESCIEFGVFVKVPKFFYDPWFYGFVLYVVIK